MCMSVGLSVGEWGAFILKNWLTGLWSLASPKFTGLADRRPGGGIVI